MESRPLFQFEVQEDQHQHSWTVIHCFGFLPKSTFSKTYPSLHNIKIKRKWKDDKAIYIEFKSKIFPNYPSSYVHIPNEKS